MRKKTDPSRRQFLVWGGAASIAVLGAAIIHDFAPLLKLRYGRLSKTSEPIRALYSKLVSSDLFSESILIMGASYLKENPKEKSVDALFLLMTGIDLKNEALPYHVNSLAVQLREQILAEARLGEVVCIENTFITKSEARVCAFLKLLSEE